MANETVETLEEILINISTLRDYINGNSAEIIYVRERIKRGICFIVVQEENGSFSFYPSKFLGYRNNNMYEHSDAIGRDGRNTNREINKILNGQPMANERFEEEYIEFCARLGISANPTGAFNKQRKYWLRII